jgi:hypothetical protein
MPLDKKYKMRYNNSYEWARGFIDAFGAFALAGIGEPPLFFEKAHGLVRNHTEAAA